MYAIIEKQTKNIVRKLTTLPGRIKIPSNGDVVFSPNAPMDIGPDHILVKATVVDPPFDGTTQVRTGPEFVVANDFSATETYSVRDKTAQELATEQKAQDMSALRGGGEKVAFVLVELVQSLRDKGAISATDFTPSTRQVWQDVKAIADRVK